MCASVPERLFGPCRSDPSHSAAFGTLSTCGTVFDGLYILPALIGGLVMGGVVDGLVRLFSGGTYLEPRPI